MNDEEEQQQQDEGLWRYVKSGAQKLGNIALSGMKKITSKVIGAWFTGGFLSTFFIALLVVGLLRVVQYLVINKYNSILGKTDANSVSSSFVEGENGESSVEEKDLIYIDKETGAYKIQEDDISHQIQNELSNQKVNNELLGFYQEVTNNDELEIDDMIDKYIKAEIQTTYPKTGVLGNEVDGIITIKRISNGSETGMPLRYEPYTKFCNMVEAGDATVLECFSLNPENFKLCIARRGSYTAYYDYNGNQVEGENSSGERAFVKEEIDYQKLIRNYSTPVEFFIALHLNSLDIDFMKEFVGMILKENGKEPIELTYVENYNQKIVTYDYIGTVEETTLIMTEAQIKKDSPYVRTIDGTIPKAGKETIQINNDNVEKYFTPTAKYYKQVSQSHSGKLYVTNANTFFKASKKEITPISTGTGSKENINDVHSEVKTEDVIIRDIIKNEKKGVRTKNVIDIKQKVTNSNSGVRYTVVDSGQEIKVDDIVDKIREYPKVENNLTSSPSNLFDMLAQQEKTRITEKIMRYVLYKLTDIDYGVREEDLAALLADDSFTESDSVGNLRKYLLQFSHDVNIGAPKSEDGKYYKMIGDGVGWPTIGNADLQWKSNYLSFRVPGKILHKGKELEVENVADYISENCLTKPASESENGLGGPQAMYSNEEVEAMDIYIEIELVDKVGDDLQIAMYNAIVEYDLNGLTLSRQQIYPLVAIKYNFGHLPEIDGREFRDVYVDGIHQEGFEEGSWQHNRYIWDSWWCKLGGGATGHIPSRDAAYETYVKGVFDFKTSSAGGVFTRNYLFYTSEQLDAFDYAPRNRNGKFQVLRTPENEEETFTMILMTGEFTESNEPYITGYYVSTNGRKFTILNQNRIGWAPKEYWDLGTGEKGDQDNGWHYKCNRAACAIIASGYSDETPEELITTMNKYYGPAGDTSVPGDLYWNLYGLTRTEYKYGFVSADDFTEIIRKQLRKGGYIAVWVNSNNMGYIGASGEQWTKNIHWMAIIDYKIENGREKMCIADARGIRWCGLDEYCHGISNYALIDEK